METIKDIVRDMREQANTWLDKRVPSFCELHDHWMITADRIEAVHTMEFDKLNKDLDLILKNLYLIMKNAELAESIVEAIGKENTRLKAALKPVLDVHITQDDESLEIYDSTMDGVLSVRAVHEEQRIYNEGAADDADH